MLCLWIADLGNALVLCSDYRSAYSSCNRIIQYISCKTACPQIITAPVVHTLSLALLHVLLSRIGSVQVEFPRQPLLRATFTEPDAT